MHPVVVQYCCEMIEVDEVFRLISLFVTIFQDYTLQLCGLSEHGDIAFITPTSDWYVASLRISNTLSNR